MSQKLKGLPGHRDVPSKLFNFRSLISHELPEITPKNVFQELIRQLINHENVDVVKLRQTRLKRYLDQESNLIRENIAHFSQLQLNAKWWVENKLPENILQWQWQNHLTWLPRRYTIYSNPKVNFQMIATDTLARFALAYRILKTAKSKFTTQDR
jgi:hypothetical protein